MRRLILTLWFTLMAVLPLQAQTLASLVADNVRLVGSTGMIAEGNVDVFYNGMRLQATAVSYDRATNSLQITGPIRLTEGDRLVILADAAELDSDLQNGMLQSARMVLDQQLQLAAAEINMVGGRYTQLYKTVASSCHTCAENPTPLWQIRALAVVHDRQERQLYFDHAQLLVMDVPVFYLPRLRLPDPTLSRATGFLIPKFRSNSRLGSGFKFPYFIRIGDHRDLTLAPYVSSSTATLEARYRQAFRTGDIVLEGAYSRDDILPNSSRGYLFAEGRFNLPRDFKLDFNLELTSDTAYLLDYGYSEKDRLDSRIAISRARRNQFLSAELIHFKSLRATEDNETIPSVVAEFLYHRRYAPGWLGGNADLQLEGHSHFRRSSTPGDMGRDVARLTARFDWRRNWVMSNGMVFGALAGATADYYQLTDQAPGDKEGLFHTATLGAELRWPMARNGANGVSHVIEPVVQLLYSDETPRGVPNEDSALLEFDEGNLFSTSRFAGNDVYERGFRANMGVSWTRYDPLGWSVGVTVGRIFRDQDHGQFTAGSGLTGASSEWLVAGQLSLANNLTLTNRALFDDKFRFSRNETRVGWHNNRIELASTYVWMDPAPAENRPQTSEWTFDGSYLFDDRWTAKADWRYDFIADRAARAGLGLQYRNECVTVDLSLSRRFTSSSSVKPTTDFGLAVSLSGFGVNTGGATLARQCRG